jgi:hypothetical protein
MGNIRGAIDPRNFPKAAFFPVVVLDARTTGRSYILPLSASRWATAYRSPPYRVRRRPT